jgi:hypothetical protein
MAIESPHIIGRAQAKALGLKRYFTGKPCKRGHVAERFVSGPCLECSREWRALNREYFRKRRAANPERARESWRRWRAANLEKAREGARLRRAKNRDRILSQQAAKRAADPQKHREYQRAWRIANRDKITNGEPPITERRAPDQSLTEPAAPAHQRGISEPINT